VTGRGFNYENRNFDKTHMVDVSDETTEQRRALYRIQKSHYAMT